MPAKAITDGTHAVVIATTEIVSKSDDVHALPIPSYWYLDIQSSGGYRRLTFMTAAARDTFYTALVNAIG